jgi:hypothetical protein
MQPLGPHSTRGQWTSSAGCHSHPESAGSSCRPSGCVGRETRLRFTSTRPLGGRATRGAHPPRARPPGTGGRGRERRPLSHERGYLAQRARHHGRFGRCRHRVHALCGTGRGRGAVLLGHWVARFIARFARSRRNRFQIRGGALGWPPRWSGATDQRLLRAGQPRRSRKAGRSIRRFIKVHRATHPLLPEGDVMKTSYPQQSSAQRRLR